MWKQELGCDMEVDPPLLHWARNSLDPVALVAVGQRAVVWNGVQEVNGVIPQVQARHQFMQPFS